MRPAPYMASTATDRLAGADRLKVDQRTQMVFIGRKGVKKMDQSSPLGVIQLNPFWLQPLLFTGSNALLHILAVGRAGRATVGRFQLDAVVAGWVMAGRNHDATGRTFMGHCIANNGGGRVAL